MTAMNRREFFLGSASAISLTVCGLLPSFAKAKSLTIQDGYSLWYNQPSMVEIDSGFILGYVTSTGVISVAHISDDLILIDRSYIHRFSDASDDSSPTIARVRSGNYSDHLLVCFSNHSSELFCARSLKPNCISEWTLKLMNTGRSTYHSLGCLPGGRILLTHTLQHRSMNTDLSEWRSLVCTFTDDGGDFWIGPNELVSYGPGTFPYSTPLAVSSTGRCALAYSLYSYKTKRHQGLNLIISDNAFLNKTELPILTDFADSFDTIPYQAVWISETDVMISYTRLTNLVESGLGMIVIVHTPSGSYHTMRLGQVACHTYPGGVALRNDGLAAFYSPISGGLIQQSVYHGKSRKIIKSGQYAQPQVLNIRNQVIVLSLQNPIIKSTINFSSSLSLVEANRFLK